MLHFAKSHVCHLYRMSPEKLVVPDQGKQFFTFIAEDRVFRIARNSHVSNAMVNEVNILNVINGKTSLLTPLVLDFRPQDHIMVTTRLPGSPLSHEGFALFSDASLSEDTMHRIGRFAGELHNRMPCGALPEYTSSWKEPALEKIAAMLEHTSDPLLRDRLEAAIDFTRNYGITPDQKVALHGDLHPGNLLYNPKTGSLGVIDFTATEAGPRHREFLKLLRSFSKQHYAMAVAAYEQTTGILIDRNTVEAGLDVYEILGSNKSFPSLKAMRPTQEGVMPTPGRPAKHPGAYPGRNMPKSER